MQTNFFPAFSDEGMMALDNAEMMSTYGGGAGGLLLDAAAFLVSPAFGFFYIGVKAGWAEAANR